MLGLERTPDVARLREVLVYDADTGLLVWRVSRGRVSAGTVAGCDRGDGYQTVRVDRKLLLSHRVAWALHYGSWPDRDLDHVSGVASDNRIDNLRLASRSENMQNAQTRRAAKDTPRGVHWHARARKWCVVLYAQKQRHYVGLFASLADAIAARSTAKARVHTFSPKAYCDVRS